MFQNFTEIAVKEIAPGFFSKLIHTENNTINFLEVKKDSELPMHHHPHEQSSFVLEGIFEMTVNGETRQLGPEDFVLIPGGVYHGGKAITDCKLIDVFSPVREDYRQ
jgi:quercetin dioxygenase-like cupin family protein